MKAIQFGAGNIGRGFIGCVLSQAGFDVVFADVVADLLGQINTRKEYTVHVMDTVSRDIPVKNIKAVNSGGDEAVAELVDADLVTTAVGLRILKFVAPTLAKGITARKEAGIEKPLNIVACENGLRATSQLKALTLALVSPEVEKWAQTHVGWPDAAVDRIVPPVRCEIPLDVAVEEYYEWDVERISFVGPIPEIEGMTPVDNLEAYVERKLFTLNTGHAAAAYIGKMKGLQTIGESIADPKICALVRGAMRQSGEGLIRKFDFNHEVHYAYIERIIRRFSNPYLRDDVDRVGREPLRKLAPNDRLILPLMTAKGYGLPYDKLLLAIGAALHFNNERDPQSIELLSSIATQGLETTIIKYTGIPAGDPLVAEIADAYHAVEKI